MSININRFHRSRFKSAWHVVFVQALNKLPLKNQALITTDIA